MTETELIIAAKVFRGNSLLNGDKISYSDSLKVVLLSRLIDNGKEFSPGELELILRLIRNRKPWYQFW